MSEGFITVHRQMMKHWIWDEPEALKFWMALLLEANWKAKKTMFNGHLITVGRGQLIFGRIKYSAKLGITENKIRRYLKLLDEEQMIHQQKTNKYTVISIVNYDQYQDNNQQITTKPPTEHQQNTTSKQSKQDIGGKTKKFIPPTVRQVQEYCDERANNINAELFVDHYTANGWYRGKNKIKDWRGCVRTWEKRNKTSTFAETKTENYL